ncbi:MAG: hypothetical protein WC979_07190 [Candidatus Pacearchaeota archaeon]|jgi:hypothetical protein
MNKKIISPILKAPLVLVIIVSFFLSVYAAYTKTYEISIGTPVLLAVILILYFIGVYIERKKEFY